MMLCLYKITMWKHFCVIYLKLPWQLNSVKISWASSHVRWLNGERLEECNIIASEHCRSSLAAVSPVVHTTMLCHLVSIQM
jgi:hypothetical protein